MEKEEKVVFGSNPRVFYVLKLEGKTDLAPNSVWTRCTKDGFNYEVKLYGKSYNPDIYKPKKSPDYYITIDDFNKIVNELKDRLEANHILIDKPKRIR